MIKCVLFDLDGTLYAEKDFVMSGFGAVSDYLSRTLRADSTKCLQILRDDFGSGVRGTNFDALIEKLGLAVSPHELVEVYRKHIPHIALYPDAEAILGKLGNSVRLGLITDGWKAVQQSKVSALGLEGRFDAITYTDTYGRENWKPSLKPFEITLEELGVEGRDSMYVADNPVKDFIGPKRLGVTTVRLRRGDGEYDSIDLDADHEAEYSIANLWELPHLIEKMNGQENR